MAMLLKRKRSASELCSPPDADNSMMDVSVPANLHSRTLKRHRDNRPSDEEVHQHTLGLLYSAQQRQPQDQPQLQAPTAAQEPVPPAAGPDTQQSLHRFWNISSEPGSGGSSPGIAIACAPPTSCEDCGSALAGGGGGDEMEVDDGAAEDTACGACGKHVCFSCSVSNLGEQKRCLQCAGRRVWIGGIGWTNAGVPVC
ncbi:hypothetical protein Trco_002732 [Trichoderma cornu-damae]|uniref:Uncharacterized protein n=1 Tax=Trichoderma cornu-damae TaxID=654480 RepID=A0A9P8QN83_9HYPO|nr:hypothetical protein Trco_002732 [Trichoderma cornu-damae]